MSYNGWTNYQTWNVALWIGNDEGLYYAARDFVGHQHVSTHREIDADTARVFCFDLFPTGTPDMDHPSDMALVDWHEIAGMLDELSPETED